MASTAISRWKLVGVDDDDHIDVVAGDEMLPVVDGVALVALAHLEGFLAKPRADVGDGDQLEGGYGHDRGGFALADPATSHQGDAQSPI